MIIIDARPTHQHIAGDVGDLIQVAQVFELLQLGDHWTDFALRQALELTIKGLALVAATIDREIKGDRPRVSAGLLKYESQDQV